MDQDDVRGLIAMMENWKLTAEAEAEASNIYAGRANSRGEAAGLQMAINALEHFVNE